MQSILFSSSFFFSPFSLAVSQPLNTFQFQMKITIRFYYYETSSCTDKNLIIQNKASTISLTMRLSCSFFIFFLENINDLQGESVFQLLSFSSFSYFFNPILPSRRNIFEQIIHWSHGSLEVSFWIIEV